ncbi:MAG: efflux RND transporter periplasmic adaptor subunit [Oleispira sp.]|nr:efflux RND transporter periplasmic adaptor subunit [Oleispira sp.]MBL4879872.1 efflux RND transporter periplasmic adaptor subunit [Oleispira sp.]
MRLSKLLIAVNLIPLMLTACMEAPKPLPPQNAPYLSPQQVTVPEFLSYTGITSASLNVDIIARTPGYVEEILFKDGQAVAADQPLYTIEYTANQVAAEKARAGLRVANASYQQASHDYLRYGRLFEKKAVSKEDLENQRLQKEQKLGDVEKAEAQLTEALKELSYTHIAAPFAGLISRSRYDVGDLVGVNGQTVMTSLVQLDPIYVNFNIASTQLQSLLATRAKQTDMPVVFTLKGDMPLEFKGELDFVDNQVSASSGTIQLRATLANPDKTLFPGQFGRVQLQVGRHENVLLIPQAVVKQDLEGSYLFAIDSNKKLQRKNVILGDSVESWIIVKSGLELTDRIVSGHLMLMRAGIEVAPSADDNFPLPEKIIRMLSSVKEIDKGE